uniref:F-box associated domain-containing protein n=1 Tax=Panagrellus redivivus TaxID=6233 RepID=A0A7E4V332_PANRE
MCKTYDKESLYLQNNGGSLDLSTRPQFFGLHNAVDWKNNTLTLVKGCLIMTYLQALDFDHPIFDHLLIDSFSISFWYGTVLNPTALRKFSQHCNTEATTSFYADDDTIFGISLPLVCDIFKNVKTLSLRSSDYAYNRWIQDILRSKKLDLKEFGIGGRFDKLFSFEPDEISQLFQAQNSEFRLILYCLDPPADAVMLIRQKLGTYFKEFQYERSGHIDGVLHIQLGDMNNTTRMWFQVVPETSRVLDNMYYRSV